MLRTESSSAVSQGYPDFYSLLSVITFLGLGLGSQIKNGPGPPINGPHNIYIINFFFFFKRDRTVIFLKTSALSLRGILHLTANFCQQLINEYISSFSIIFSLYCKFHYIFLVILFLRERERLIKTNKELYIKETKISNS